MELIYFAYGSNLYTPRLLRRVPSARLYRTATLQGHELRFHKNGADGSAKANAFFTGNDRDCVHGVLYTLAAADRPLLDRCEGGYDRREVEVLTAEKAVTAFSYFARRELLDETLRPFQWYKAYVQDGARMHELPPDYVTGIEALSAINDPDPERAAQHLEFLGRSPL